MFFCFFFFFKQKTAYEMRISDWSSDVCSSDLFEVMALTAARSWVKIGALFEQTIRSSGESFYQGRLDDPSMSSPMDIALFANNEDGYNISWTRRRARQELTGGGEPAVPPTDGGGAREAPAARQRTSLNS